ncbi:hypothetical protein SCLCIDRAFT_1218342 [Scleroderma citrinum Foug A]|uniref:Uncharacterized protein n=1 Tax=Scleroderma citrinum Foug A TaxID=1036808 RepID=A0A0C3DS39_9AGAM|nr:hypothetical protein SCLCIDRAFT_1218342 [Scleroderma citrinum Foug A]
MFSFVNPTAGSGFAHNSLACPKISSWLATHQRRSFDLGPQPAHSTVRIHLTLTPLH